jgi:hypothetical protein
MSLHTGGFKKKYGLHGIIVKIIEGNFQTKYILDLTVLVDV